MRRPVESALAAAVAAIPAWGLAELVWSDDPAHLVTSAAIWVGAFGAVFGAVYGAWDDITSQVWEKAAPAALVGALVGAVAGAISGAIAQEVFSAVVKSIVQNATASSGLDPSDAKFYLARALGWAIFGLGVGAAVGAAQRSVQKLINGLLGGVIGGALGGLFFYWVAFHIDSQAGARFLGLGVIAIAIGAAIGLIEVARRQAWVKIVGGGMKGKEFILYHPNTQVGSSPKCQLTLIKDPAIAAFHFRIDEQRARRLLTASEGCPVAINGAPVNSQWLQNNDVIQVGNTSIAYQERALAT